MYCRKCGKQIADDSVFCQYCGGKVYPIIKEDGTSHDNDCTIVTANNESRLKEHNNECIIETKNANPIQVEVSKKTATPNLS